MTTSATMEKGKTMENKECAKYLVELYSDYYDLAGKYSRPVIEEYAEAIAMAIMLLGERKANG